MYKSEQPLVVAFLYTTCSVYHNEVYDNFMKSADESLPSNCNRIAFSISDIKDKVLIKNVCDRIFNLRPSCIIVVGRILTQSLVELSKKRRYKGPIVFIGVDKPVEMGVIESLDTPGGNVTGLFTKASDATIMPRLMHAALPQHKKILVPFHVGSDIGQTVEVSAFAVKEYLESKGDEVTVMPIDSLPNALDILESVVGQYDSLMVLEACTLGSMVPGFLKFAENYKMKLMATIPDKDFLLSYAIEPRYISAAAVDLVKSIICDKKNPATTPVVRMSSSRECMINTKRAAELGISLDIEHIMNQINTDPALEVVRNRVRIV